MFKSTVVFASTVLLLSSGLAFADQATDAPEAATPAKQDVLATCTAPGQKEVSMQMLGDAAPFKALRVSALTGTVELKDASNQAVFNGTVSLVKTSAYQYVLMGQETNKDGLVSATVSGISSGSAMNIYVSKNQTGMQMPAAGQPLVAAPIEFVCTLNPDLLLAP